MRALFAIALLTMPLAACAVGFPSSSSAPYRNEPLAARILPTSQNLAFSVNRPAYVAIFEVVPGQGVGLVYPSRGSQSGLLSAGYHRPLVGDGSFRWAYNRGYAASYASARPRLLYMIASQRPLRIDRFVNSPTALRSTLGFSQFESRDPYETLDQLDAMVVPHQLAPDEWASDLYMIWPREPRLADARQQRIVVRCADGRTVALPLYYAALACPNDDRNRARPPAENGNDDEDEVREAERPIRKRPASPREGADEPTRVAPTAEPRDTRPSRAEPRDAPRRAEPRRVEPSSTPSPQPRVERTVRPARDPALR